MSTITDTYRIALIGAGGKMGMRVSNNLAKTAHSVAYVENSPAGAQRTIDAGRALTDAAAAVADADIVVFAVPDLALASVTADLVPKMKSGAIALTLDPQPRTRVCSPIVTMSSARSRTRAIPSIFLQRQTPEEWADRSAASPPRRTRSPRSVGRPCQAGDRRGDRAGDLRTIVDVHSVTISIAQLEPTLVGPSRAVGALLNERCPSHQHHGIPRRQRSVLCTGHARSPSPMDCAATTAGFSTHCLIAIDYRQREHHQGQLPKIFRDDELDKNLARVLHRSPRRTSERALSHAGQATAERKHALVARDRVPGSDSPWRRPLSPRAGVRVIADR